MSIADIGIRVYLEDAASLGLGTLSGGLRDMGLAASLAAGSWADLSAQMMSTAALLGLGIAVAGLGAAMFGAVQNAISMQSILIQIQRATNGTTDQMKQMQQVLMSIGGSSIYSLEQLAAGFVLLGQRGISASDIINGVGQQMTYLAEATGTQPVDAAGLLASTLASFNLTASNSAHVVDLLQFAFEHGVPSVDQLQSAIAKLGSIATVLNIPLDQVIPALDVMSRAMGSGTTAATSLYYFLNQVKDGTATFKDEIASLGISFYDAQGNFIGLNQSLQLLYTTLQDKTPETQAKILGSLFNIRSSQGIGILMADFANLTTLAHQLASSNDNAGMAILRAGQVANSAAGLWASLTSNLRDVLTLVGGPLLSALQPLLSNLQAFSVTLREFSAQNATILAVILSVATAVTGFAAIFIFASTALGLFTLIALGVAGAVALLVVGAVFVQQHWNQVTSAFNAALPIIQSVSTVLLVLGAIMLGWSFAPWVIGFGQLIGLMIHFGIEAILLIPTIVTLAGRMLMAAAAGTVWAIQNASTVIPSIVATTVAWLANAAATLIALAPYILIAAVVAGAIIGLVLLVQHLGVVNVALSIMRAVWAALLPAFQQAATEIRGALMQSLQQLAPVWSQLMQAFNQARPALLALGIVLGVLLAVAIAIIIGVLRALIVIITVLIVTAIHVVAGVIQAFAGLVQFFLGLFTVIHGIFTGNTAEIQAGFRAMGQGILNIVQGLFSAVVAVFVGTFNLITGVVSGFVGGVVGFFHSLWSQLVGHSIIPEMLSAMLSMFFSFGPMIISAFAVMVGGIIGQAEQLPGRILSAIGNLGSLLFGAGQAVVQGLINGLSSMLGNLMGAASNLLSSVRDLFPHSPAKEGPLVDLHTWMPNVIKILADTTESSGPALRASMGTVAGGVKSGLYGGIGSTGGTARGSTGETYTLTVDGKAFLSFFHDQLTGQLQANGVGRLLR